MKILLTICARGGSKGIPGKNIKELNGIPLIVYSIRTGLRFQRKQPVDMALSTDSPLIKEVAEEHGLKCSYTRPDHLATDKAGKLVAIEDLLYHQEAEKGFLYDYIIDLDVTSPLRSVKDIEEALSILQQNTEAFNIFSVSPASRNPYFNMVQKGEDDFVKIVMGNSGYKTRQEAPAVYDMNASFYIYRRSFFEGNHPTSMTKRSLAYVVPHMCFDLDEPHDFTIMEIMLREKLLDFDL